VVDVDEKGVSYYADTQKLQAQLAHVTTDAKRSVQAIMHNKFVVIDAAVVWTGSANASDSCTGGYNVNFGLILWSPDVAARYIQELQQMAEGRFGMSKQSFPNTSVPTDVGTVRVYFSPQDSPLEKVVIPALERAERSIDLAVFYLTQRDVLKILKAKAKSGVKVRIILDASAVARSHATVHALRKAGAQVKVENWGGKMHAKTGIIDGELTILGSLNWTVAGSQKNDENILAIKGDAAKQALVWFENLWRILPDYTLRSIPKAEGRDSPGSCTDALDNDYDGRIDDEDSACKAV